MIGALLARWRKSRAVVTRPVSRIPILTYHGAHSPGYVYAENDHLALEQDLLLIRRLGFKIAPLGTVVDFVLGMSTPLSEGHWVAVTFDDAPDCDYFDLLHPDIGCLKSFYRILVESRGLPRQEWPQPTAVSFAIASPEARVEIDRACLAGRGHWRDHWWYDAAQTGVLGLANHSWDHAHLAVTTVCQRDQRKGTFLGIDNERDADLQVLRAQRYLWFRTGGLALPYFAYPYGEASDYLRLEYFPQSRGPYQIRAAFGTQGDYATTGADRWQIPRFVFGEHWKSTDELEHILHLARGAASTMS